MSAMIWLPNVFVYVPVSVILLLLVTVVYWLCVLSVPGKSRVLHMRAFPVFMQKHLYPVSHYAHFSQILGVEDFFKG